MSHQCSFGWQSMWIATTVGKPAHKSQSIATLQSATTPWQGLATWHPELQIRPQIDPRQCLLSIPNDQRTTKNALLLALQLTFTEGVSLKIQNPPTRSLQSQLLVTDKMLDTLKVSQDFMWAMRQHRNVLAADATKEMAQFASCIGSPSDEEQTHFICPAHFFNFVRELWPHMTTEKICFWFVCAGVTSVSNIWTKTCSTLSQMLKSGI